jgi:hypothetical protein
MGDPAQLRAAAAALLEYAYLLDRCLESLDALVSDVTSSAWTGRGADAFVDLWVGEFRGEHASSTAPSAPGASGARLRHAIDDCTSLAMLLQKFAGAIDDALAQWSKQLVHEGAELALGAVVGVAQMVLIALSVATAQPEGVAAGAAIEAAADGQASVAGTVATMGAVTEALQATTAQLVREWLRSTVQWGVGALVFGAVGNYAAQVTNNLLTGRGPAAFTAVDGVQVATGAAHCAAIGATIGALSFPALLPAVETLGPVLGNFVVYGANTIFATGADQYLTARLAYPSSDPAAHMDVFDILAGAAFAAALGGVEALLRGQAARISATPENRYFTEPTEVIAELRDTFDTGLDLPPRLVARLNDLLGRFYLHDGDIGHSRYPQPSEVEALQRDVASWRQPLGAEPPAAAPLRRIGVHRIREIDRGSVDAFGVDDFARALLGPDARIWGGELPVSSSNLSDLPIASSGGPDDTFQVGALNVGLQEHAGIHVVHCDSGTWLLYTRRQPTIVRALGHVFTEPTLSVKLPSPIPPFALQLTAKYRYDARTVTSFIAPGAGRAVAVKLGLPGRGGWLRILERNSGWQIATWCERTNRLRCYLFGGLASGPDLTPPDIGPKAGIRYVADAVWTSRDGGPWRFKDRYTLALHAELKYHAGLAGGLDPHVSAGTAADPIAIPMFRPYAPLRWAGDRLVAGVRALRDLFAPAHGLEASGFRWSDTAASTVLTVAGRHYRLSGVPSVAGDVLRIGQLELAPLDRTGHVRPGVLADMEGQIADAARADGFRRVQLAGWIGHGPQRWWYVRTIDTAANEPAAGLRTTPLVKPSPRPPDPMELPLPDGD